MHGEPVIWSVAIAHDNEFSVRLGFNLHAIAGVRIAAIIGFRLADQIVSVDPNGAIEAFVEIQMHRFVEWIVTVINRASHACNAVHCVGWRQQITAQS